MADGTSVSDAARNVRIETAAFLNRSCAFGPALEQKLLAGFFDALR